MRKIVLIILAIALFVLAYQVRIGFLETKDYNHPADATEFMGAAANAVQAIKHTTSLNSLPTTFPWLIQALDAHSAPTTMSYLTLVNLFFSGEREQIAAIFSALLVSLIFFISLRFFSFWISLFIAGAAVIYTPLYSYIYSYMAESFGGFFVPMISLIVVFLLLRVHKKFPLAILAGIFMGIMALYRIEFRWIGIPLIIGWYFVNYKEKKKLILTGLMFFFFFLVVLGWMGLSKAVNPNQYYAGNVTHVLHNTYDYSTSGWLFDTSPIRKASDLYQHIISQGPLKLLWLQLAIPIRLWTRPATVYIGEYPIPDMYLFALHILLVGLAIFGLRKAFFNKVFFFLAIVLVWVSFLSFNPEELRRQIPLVGIMLLFAGAGISELHLLLKNKSFRKILFLIISLGGIMMISEQLLYGFLTIFYPRFVTILPLRALIIGIEFFFAFKITQRLFIFDKKRKQVVKNSVVNKIPSLIPLLAVFAMTIYYLKMPYWHEWSTVLLPNDKIQQTIVIDKDILMELKEKKGYLLVDIKDPNAAKDIEVILNQKPLTERLTIWQSFSPVDVRVLRQFQRGMPRLGWGTVEDKVASMSAFPNVHQWIAQPIQGNMLKEKNIITVKNKSQSLDNPPSIYGDYYFSLSSNPTYDGPTPRIFQGPASFYKFQVDGEIRLPLRRIVHSKNNTSEFFENEKEIADDLSHAFGIQTGRYRIFLLFTYISSDPEDIF